MSEDDDIKERLTRIERDISWLIQYLLKKDQPLQPPPYIPNGFSTPTTVPTWSDKVCCARCGMDLSGSIGYVCNDMKCPTQTKITC